MRDTQDGRVGWRARLCSQGKPVDEDGFSDHFPIGVQVIEAD